MIRMHIVDELARRIIMDRVANEPLWSWVSIGPEIKSRDQEAKYHAIIGEIAMQAQHVGATWDAESWKRLMLDGFAKFWNEHCESPEKRIVPVRLIPNLSGDGVIALGIQSRSLSKEQGSAFIEYLHKWCAENGVELSR